MSTYVPVAVPESTSSSKLGSISTPSIVIPTTWSMALAPAAIWRPELSELEIRLGLHRISLNSSFPEALKVTLLTTLDSGSRLTP